MRIYLDTCCYNRRFDNDISDDFTTEKRTIYEIQKKIVKNNVELATSFMLHYEILQIKDDDKRDNIEFFIKMNRTIYIGIDYISKLDKKVENIIKSGIKHKDAYHIASAILADCDYFITFDKKILKYNSDEVKIINPVDFLKVWSDDDEKTI